MKSSFIPLLTVIFLTVAFVQCDSTTSVSPKQTKPQPKPLPELELIAPSNNADNQSTEIEFNWKSIDKVTEYQFQIAQNKDLDSTLVDSIVKESSFSTSQLEFETSYFWRVRSVSGGQTGAWSNIWQFTTNNGKEEEITVDLKTPDDGANIETTSPVFEWTSTIESTEYHYQLSMDQEFSDLVSDSVVESAKVKIKELSNDDYYWRVSPILKSATGKWSEVHSFTIDFPNSGNTKVSLTSPSDGATDQPTTITLEWEVLMGVSDYQVQLANSASFASLIADEKVDSNSIEITGLENSKTYYWRVQVNSDGNTENWSSFRNFITIAETSNENEPAGSIEGDYQALQDFYKAMGGPNWDNNTGWANMTPQTMGDAFGVVVYESGPNAGRVKELNLSGYPIGRDDKGRARNGAPIGNNLSGDHIPESFGKLKELTHLRLKGNEITARLDNWLPKLESAVWLSLNGSVGYGGQDEIVLDDYTHYNHASKTWRSHNKFEGPLPDFSHLTDLKMLELMSTNLRGELPDELPPNIQGLFLSNSYLSDELPPAWGKADKLTHLFLSNRDGNESGVNNHYGSIPPEWDGMKEMRWFLLGGNNLSGAIPEFTSWYDLRYFGVNMEGNMNTSFPSWLFEAGKHQNLHTMNLGSMSIWTGNEPGMKRELPSSQPNSNIHTGLYVFAVPDNSVTGKLYQWTVDHTTTQYNVRDNNFTGQFPSLKIADRLRWVRAENNEFTGQLPEINPVHDNFQQLRFHKNQFSGDIPSSYGQIESTGGLPFTDLLLHDNLLDGHIPRGIFGNGWKITLQNNKYTPEDLVPIMNENLSKVIYLPQKPFGRSETLSAGATIDRSSFAYDGNRYQWYKNGEAISGATAPTIDTGNYGTGTYTLKITHPDIDYTFTSEEIHVKDS